MLRRTFLLILLLSGFNWAKAQDQKPVYVGIPAGKLYYVAAPQRKSQWCWAASIQMVLNYYGVAINQEDIVARTYGADWCGKLPDWPGSFQAVTANLNNWSIDNLGQQYMVQANLFVGAPRVDILLHELSQGFPLIIGYHCAPQCGHAVVVTAASYIQGANGPIIQSIVVRDPWPSPENIANRGRVEYPAANLALLMDAHWYIRVSR